ncbi:hypothetical protein O0555_20105 [Brevibacillus laterosporus]|uniref:hypothetical protein n=2 Tax=Brevibacillus laterosporus TaxID=1465 RepID=UPI0018CE97A7|nr:hypothetical protein [Brevibacillus laterosporus]MBG9797775.1 hypothetical protein [Brevibacillus laterosporus]MCR8939604.1 hypothetical protein [Brevibacillus laterosporus]MCZ0842244.1 hypothetical protein [Brevibacillus laterosporus]MCZ0846187.1 hypothetical protein [Brevibacillus laterosporus]MED1912673.1 hypothetical protein [Brevibacillus laterosporus]
MMNFMLSIWGIILVLIIGMKITKAFYYKRYFQIYVSGSEEITELHDMSVFLFLSYTDPRNAEYLAEISRRFPKYQIYIIYKAPEWKARVLSRQINDLAKLRVDEQGMMSDDLRISAFPAYLTYQEIFKKIPIVRFHTY